MKDFLRVPASSFLRVRFFSVESGSSAAWLARLPWEQEVGSSNLLSPTISIPKYPFPHPKLLAHYIEDDIVFVV